MPATGFRADSGNSWNFEREFSRPESTSKRSESV